MTKTVNVACDIFFDWLINISYGEERPIKNIIIHYTNKKNFKYKTQVDLKKVNNVQVKNKKRICNKEYRSEKKTTQDKNTNKIILRKLRSRLALTGRKTRLDILMGNTIAYILKNCIRTNNTQFLFQVIYQMLRKIYF